MPYDFGLTDPRDLSDTDALIGEARALASNVGGKLGCLGGVVETLGKRVQMGPVGGDVTVQIMARRIRMSLTKARNSTFSRLGALFLTSE